MRFTLLEADAFQFFLVYAVSGFITLLIFYYIIKAAVKNGILEARAAETKPTANKIDPAKPVSLDNVNDIDVLHYLYNSAQISLADYQAKLMELQGRNK